MRHTLTVLVISLAAAGWASSVHAQSHGHTMITPSELKWVDAPALPSGAKTAVLEGPPGEGKAFTTRLSMPANYKIPPHVHPHTERLTVLSGTFYLGMGERYDESKLHVLPSGGIAVMAPGTPHFAITKEPTVLQFHGVGPVGIRYLDPKDDPRNQ